jgi:hypothetical protein
VKLTASLDSDLFATVDDANATTDGEGVAKLQLQATMPGMSALTVQAQGTALRKTVNLLTTADSNKTARPTVRFVDEETGATVKTIGLGAPAENTVYLNKPTRMYIDCTTEDAAIYYTLDGSCPCQNTSGRAQLGGENLLLDGTTNADFIIAAYKDGMDYSERLKVFIRVGQEPVQLKDLSGADVTVAAQTYTGKELTPEPVVKLKGKTLVKGTHYDVKYANNTNAGKATVTVTGLASGGYTGKVSVKFAISPKKITPVVTLAKAVLVCADFRKESRGAHVRSDYPDRKKEWEAATIISHDQGAYRTRLDMEREYES